jgi:hypothetical protein
MRSVVIFSFQNKRGRDDYLVIRVFVTTFYENIKSYIKSVKKV